MAKKKRGKKKAGKRKPSRKRLKKRIRKIRRKAGRKAVELMYRAFFKSCYLVGLSFLIPFILTYALPEAGEEWYKVPLIFFFLALFLVMFSFYGLLWRHKRIGKTFKSLGFMSLVPGLIAAMVATIGRQKLVQAVLAVHGGESTLAALNFYIDRTVPKIKVLVLGYIVIGLFFYWVGTKLEE
jgi:hypothetical protein